MFHITSTPSKGQGIIARQAIPAGTQILSERPIARGPGDQSHADFLAAITRQLHALPTEQYLAFLALKNNGNNECPIDGISNTNTIPIGPNESEGGIFLTCARLNHSCTANAAYHWFDVAQELRLCAIRDIQVGEEITVSYLDEGTWTLPGKERRAQILASYSFECSCVRCLSDDDGSDARRTRLGEMNRAVRDGQLYIWNPSRTLAHCREALDMLEKEGEGATHFEAVYYNAFKACIAHGDLARASTFAERGLEAKRIRIGNEASELGATEELVDKPFLHDLAFVTSDWFSLSESEEAEFAEASEEWLWRRAE